MTFWLWDACGDGAMIPLASRHAAPPPLEPLRQCDEETFRRTYRARYLREWDGKPAF